MIYSAYNLKRILRCNSFENDPLDDYSQIWDLKFEPSLIVGQDILNIINFKNGTIESRFKCPRRNGKFEELYAICWSQVQYKDDFNQSTYFIATAGLLKCIYIIQPNQLSWHENLCGHTTPIKSLCFHPIRTNWLFSGDISGNIILWDLSFPTLNKPRIKSRKCNEFKISTNEEILQICISHLNEVLIASTSHGIYIWNDFIDDRRQTIDSKNGPSIQLIIPQLNCVMEEDLFFYRICLLSKELLAVKSSFDARIYILNLNDTNLLTENTGKIELKVIAVLEGPLGNGPFNKMSSNYGFEDYKNDVTYLSIGNDTGDICIYNLTQLVLKHSRSSFNSTSHSYARNRLNDIYSENSPAPIDNIPHIEPTDILKWNNNSNYLSSGGTPLPDWENISKIVNCNSISPDGKYVIGGMASNLITIWERDD